MARPRPRSRRAAATPISRSRCSPRANNSASASSTESALPSPARARARRIRWARSVTTASNLRPHSASGKHGPCSTVREDRRVKVTALAGGIGAGKFLRGLVRVVDPADVTVVVNTGDDIEVHGLFVSPDVDSVTYWLAGLMDRERGWGRAGETFRSTEELRRLGAGGSWFGLGDLDLATHLLRTSLLRAGRGLA